MKTNWKAIDFKRVAAVSFDLGWTIIGPNHVRIAEYAEHILGFQIEPSALGLAERLVYVKNHDDNKVVDGHYANLLGEAIKILLPDHGEKIDPQLFIAFYKACRKYQDEFNFFEIVYPDALAALELLKAGGKRVIAISNAGGTLERDLTRIGIRGYFEFIVDSGVEKVAKPDKEIFVRAADRLGLKAESILHIGDNPDADVRGALNAGYQAALYDPCGYYPRVDGSALHFRSHLDLAEKLVPVY